MPDACAAMRPDHDQINAFIPGKLDDFIERYPMDDISIAGCIFWNQCTYDFLKLARGVLLEFRIQLRQNSRTEIELRKVCYILQYMKDVKSSAKRLVKLDCILQSMHGRGTEIGRYQYFFYHVF